MSVESLAQGFINHAKLAFNRNAGVTSPVQANFRHSVSKNMLEKIGDGMVWHVTKGLRKLGRLCRDPRVLTVALTAMAMLAVTFAFYPVSTFLASKTVLVFISANLPWVAVKGAAYAATALAIVGTGTRMLGRVTNKDLMDHFYASHGYRLDSKDYLQPLEVEMRAREAANRPPVALPQNAAIEQK